MDNINRGDIYYIVSNYQEEGSEQRAGRPAVVVSNNMCNQHSGVVEIVYLTTQPKSDLPTHIDIRSATKPSIALCEQICSVSKDRLGNYIGTCSEYELQMLDAALLISLGIDMPAPKVVEKVIEKKVVEPPKQEDAIKLPEQQVVPYDEFIKSQTERDTYKSLYDSLLEKVIGGRIAV